MLKIALRTILILVGLMVLIVWYFYAKEYDDFFQTRRGTLADVHIEPVGSDSVFEKSWIRISNREGFTVNCGLLEPREKWRRYPTIVLLGGMETGKYAIDYVLDAKNLIVAAPDYPYEPRESYTVLQFLADAPAMRHALLDMVPTVMLLIDYLSSRSDVDTTKLVLVGYSFGAPFVPSILAHDRRPSAGAMVYGGGGLRSLIAHNVSRYKPALVAECAGALGGLLLRPLEPLRYVDQISPTPLIMVNGRSDKQIPRENVESLYTNAGEPKKLIWLESDHVHPGNEELTRLIVNELTRELAALGVLDTLSVQSHAETLRSMLVDEPNK